MAFFRVNIRLKWVIIPFCRCSKILGEAGKQKNFTTNVLKILVLKSSSEQIFSRKLPLGAPVWSSNKHRIPLIGCGVYGDVYSRAAFDLANG